MSKVSVPTYCAVCRWCLAVFLFVAIAYTGLAADLFTKHWMFQAMGMPGERPAYWIWQDVAGVQTSLNTGALFGMGAGQTSFLVVLSLIFLIGILCYTVLWAWQDWFLSIILGMITAGICGNLYDRLGWHGLIWTDSCHPHPAMVGQPVYAVRDWILCMIGTFHWPNFNIADALLVCSIMLLLLHIRLFETESPSAPGGGK